MVSKRLKLHQFFDGVARNFSYTQACKNHLATLFDNTNAVSKPEQGDQIQIVHGAFCQTFTKFSQIHRQITNNIL